MKAFLHFRLARLLVGAGPDADRRAKQLIHQAMEGSLLDAFLRSRISAATKNAWKFRCAAFRVTICWRLRENMK